FSRYTDLLSEYWSKYDPEWSYFRERALSLLEEASKIEETARIVGEKALPDEQRLVLLFSEIVREGFLVQHAYHEVDTYCEPEKQAAMLRFMVEFYDMVEPLVRGRVPVDKIREMPSLVEVMRLKERKGLEWIDKVRSMVEGDIRRLAEQYGLAF
ncbi:MAG: V-type ATP synthase subunit A, partial [Candidatus Bathyarchaeia archaeon]